MYKDYVREKGKAYDFINANVLDIQRENHLIIHMRDRDSSLEPGVLLQKHELPNSKRSMVD